MEIKDTIKTFYRVYNVTTDLLCCDFEDKDELKTYLSILRSKYPKAKFSVYKVTITTTFTITEW